MCGVEFQSQKLICNIIKKNLESVGFKINIISFDGSQNFTDVLKRTDMFLMCWVSEVEDLEDYIISLFNPTGENICGYKNEEILGLLSELKTIVNPEKRKVIFKYIEDIFKKEQAFIPIWYSENVIFHKENVLGLKMDTLSIIRFEDLVLMKDAIKDEI